MTQEIARIHTTDTYTLIAFTLKRKNSAGVLTAEDLTGLSAGAVQFKMFNAATGAEVVALTSTGVTFTADTAGNVEYDFSVSEVSSAGIYNAFFVVTKFGQTIHFPIAPGELRIELSSDTQTARDAYQAALDNALLNPGTITDFPETLTIGNSYTELNGRSIRIPIVGDDGIPTSVTGSLNFADADATFVIKRAGETDTSRIITGNASFVDPPGTDSDGEPYALVQLSSSETGKGLLGYKYSGILTFTWPGTDSEVVSFETETIKFDN